MNPKTTIGLLAALALAVLGLWWAQSSEKALSESVPSGPRLLFDPQIDQVASFEIVTPGSGETLKFESDEAGKWRLTSPVQAPAEHYLVNSDAQKLKDLVYVKSYPAADPDRPTDEMTSLSSPLRIVKLTGRAGTSYVLKIGARQALSTNTYVQKDGDDTVYLVSADLNADLKRGLADYRGKRVAELDQNEAVRIEASGEHRYTLVKSGSNWTVEEPVKARADLSKINSLLSSISNLQAAKFVDDRPASLRSYGLEQPRFAIRVTLEKRTLKAPPQEQPASAPAVPEYEVTTRVVGLLFGGKADDQVFAKLAEPDSPSVFQAPESTFKTLAQSLDDLRDKRVVNVGPARFQRIEIATGDRRVELTSQDNVWQITGGLADGLPQPAEFAAVDDVMKAIRNLTAVGFESSESPQQGFSAPRAVINAAFEGTVEPMRLVFGGETPSGTGIFVKNEKEGFVAVVKADSVNAFTNPPASFMNRDLLRVNPDHLSRLEVNRPEPALSCALEKVSGIWRLVEPVEGESEASAVRLICNDLSMLRGRKVVAAASDAGQFGLDKPDVRLAMTIQEPPPEPTTQTSQPADAAMPPAPVVRTLLVSRQGESVYAMVEGGGTICEIDPKIFDDLTAELMDRRVASVEPSGATGLAFAGQSTMSFEKIGDDWKLKGEPTFPVDGAKITEVLNALRDLRAERYVRYRGANLTEFGLDAPAATVTAEFEGASPVTLMISSRGPTADDRYAAVASQAGRVFVINGDDAERFTRKVADFQKAG